MEYYNEVDYNLAPKGKRLLNYVIDAIVAYGFIIMVFSFLMILGIITEFFTYLENNELLDRIVTTFFYVLVIFGQEVIFKGQSVGKFITKTKVVAENGHTPTYKTLAVRNLLRLIPWDQLSFLGNIGWHDKWSNTRVVDIKGFERDKQENQEKEAIDQIGNSEEI